MPRTFANPNTAERIIANTYAALMEEAESENEIPAKAPGASAEQNSDEDDSEQDPDEYAWGSLQILI
jgi:hypothetical protein